MISIEVLLAYFTVKLSYLVKKIQNVSYKKQECFQTNLVLYLSFFLVCGWDISLS
jgi:hypothetical protein